MREFLQRLRNKSAYIRITALLTVIFLLSFLGWKYAKATGNKFLAALSIGIMTSVISAAIVVFGIDQILKYEKRTRQEPVIRVALESLITYLNQYANLVAQMAKASAEEPWDNSPKNFQKLFSKKTAKQICYCLNLDSKAPVAQKRVDWRTFLHNEFKKFEREINNLITKYGAYLPEPILARAEKMTTSMIGIWALKLPTIKKIDQQNNFSRPPAFAPGLEDKIEEDFQNILNLIKSITTEAEKLEIPPPKFPTGTIERDDIAPKVGDSRFEWS